MGQRLAFVVAACCLILAGCGQDRGPMESIGPVTVRATNWGRFSAMVVEFDNGYLKTLDPTCQHAVAAWPGMRAKITFYWNNEALNECYQIVSVQRAY